MANKTFKQKMAKFWDESKLDIIPVAICFAILGVLGGAWLGADKYATKKHAEKQAEAAKAALDTANMAKDTVAMNVAQKQK